MDAIANLYESENVFQDNPRSGKDVPPVSYQYKHGLNGSQYVHQRLYKHGKIPQLSIFTYAVHLAAR